MKEKITSMLQKTTVITNWRYVKIIMNAFISISAIAIAGSFFNLIKSIPITPWLNFLDSSGIGALLSIPVSVSSDLMGIFVCLAVAYHTAKEFKKNCFAASLISFCAYMVLTPFETNFNGEVVSGVIPIPSVGAQGIFLAIISGILASRLYCFLLDHNVRIKMPDSVPENVAKMFEDMVPGGIVFLVFVVVRYVVSLTPFETAQALIYKLLQSPLMLVGGGMIGCIVYMLAVRLFWFFGVHGGMVVYAAMAAIIGTVTAANNSAFAAGTPAPYPEWILVMTSYYSIMPIGLSLLMMIFGKSERFKMLGKVSLPASIFNIGEPVTYGFPIVYNFVMFMPYMFCPLLIFGLTYGGMKLGFLPMVTGASVSPMVPMILAGALMTKSWIMILWGIAMTILGMACYFPFFKVADSKAVADEKALAAAKAQQEEAEAAKTAKTDAKTIKAGSK